MHVKDAEAVTAPLIAEKKQQVIDADDEGSDYGATEVKATTR